MAVYRPDPVLLERQIESLRKQTVADWRCLIGIDGADPKTQQLLLELTCEDARFEVREYADNVGVYRHFERLLREVDSDTAWVALADQDDYWYPDKFERLLPRLVTGVAAVSGQARLVDRNGSALGVTTRRSGSMLDLLLRNQVTGGLTVFRSALLEKALPFPVSTDIAIHDHWLGVCAAATGEVEIVDELVQDYVQHGRNVLGEAEPTSIPELLRRVRSAGGWTAHINQVSTQVWGWRVAMARRGLSLPLGGRDRKALIGVSQGRISLTVIAIVGRALMRRHVSPRMAIGFTAAAAWWPRGRGGHLAVHFE